MSATPPSDELQRQADGLRRARANKGWSQTRLIAELERTASQLSRESDLPSRSTLSVYVSMFENGRRQVPEHLKVIYREAFQLSDEEVGFSAHSQIVVPKAPPLGSAELSPRAGAMVVSGLRDVLQSHINADALLGPSYVVPAVQGQLPLIDQVCRVTTGSERQEALRFGSKFAEFCGWLYQDLGDYRCAMELTSRAVDYALELGDPRVISYNAMRRSNVASQAGEPGQALSLANTSLSQAEQLTPRLRAVALRQRAHARAALGQRREFQADAEAALADAWQGVEQEEDDRAAYATPEYVDMEVGAGWLRIGDPRRAIQVLEASRSRWAEGGQERDRTLCSSRLATAYAQADDLDAAGQIIEEILPVARGIGSVRVLGELRQVSGHLARWSGAPEVLAQLDELTQVATTVRSGS